MNDPERKSSKGRGRSAKNTGRSAARLTAVQALYEMDLAGAGADPVLQDFMADRWRNAGAEDGQPPLAEPDGELLALLVRGVAGRQADLDAMIDGALAGGLTIERLQAVMRAILRAGAFELLARPETPAKVVLADYLDVAKAFFLGTESSLVNGVLDRLARTLRPTEMEGAGHGANAEKPTDGG
ncbi:MAG: transcription antitermination factor NusB [Magnetospirillum sp. WYHS-4]